MVGALTWLLLFIALAWSAARMTEGLVTGRARCGSRAYGLASAPRRYWLFLSLDIAVFLLAAGLVAALAAQAP